MNLFADIRELVVAELQALMAAGVLPSGLDLAAVAVEPPRDQGHGEMATNAAMVLAKPAIKVTPVIDLRASSPNQPTRPAKAIS